MEDFITKASLTTLGINLEGKDIDSLLEHMNETLQERIGTELTNELDDDKLEELVKMQETASDEEIGAWLKANVAEFDQIVQDEIDIILGELVKNSDGINKVA